MCYTLPNKALAELPACLPQRSKTKRQFWCVRPRSRVCVGSQGTDGAVIPAEVGEALGLNTEKRREEKRRRARQSLGPL